MENSFERILADFFKENFLSQRAFAKQIGVKPSQVSEWLKGKAKPGFDNLRAIARAFDISADYFLGLIDIY